MPRPYESGAKYRPFRYSVLLYLDLQSEYASRTGAEGDSWKRVGTNFGHMFCGRPPHCDNGLHAERKHVDAGRLLKGAVGCGTDVRKFADILPAALSRLFSVLRVSRIFLTRGVIGGTRRAAAVLPCITSRLPWRASLDAVVGQEVLSCAYGMELRGFQLKGGPLQNDVRELTTERPAPEASQDETHVCSGLNGREFSGGPTRQGLCSGHDLVAIKLHAHTQ